MTVIIFFELNILITVLFIFSSKTVYSFEQGTITHY